MINTKKEEIRNKKDLCSDINRLTRDVLSDLKTITKYDEYFRKYVKLLGIKENYNKVSSNFFGSSQPIYEDSQIFNIDLEFWALTRFIFWSFINKMREYEQIISIICNTIYFDKIDTKYKELYEYISNTKLLKEFISYNGYQVMSKCMHNYSDVTFIEKKKCESKNLIDYLNKWLNQMIDPNFDYESFQNDMWKCYEIICKIRNEENMPKRTNVNYCWNIVNLFDRIYAKFYKNTKN